MKYFFIYTSEYGAVDLLREVWPPIGHSESLRYTASHDFPCSASAKTLQHGSHFNDSGAFSCSVTLISILLQAAALLEPCLRFCLQDLTGGSWEMGSLWTSPLPLTGLDWDYSPGLLPIQGQVPAGVALYFKKCTKDGLITGVEQQCIDSDGGLYI